jgi:DNA-binding NarL/FixJ family response regulator
VTVSVLIVDDDEGFRSAAAELLVTHGYHVAGQAANGRDAIARAIELNPDAVLLDVNLPDEDGVAVAARLRAGADAPSVLLTSTDSEAVSQCLLERCGASGFVAKTDLATTDLDRYFKR